MPNNLYASQLYHMFIALRRPTYSFFCSYVIIFLAIFLTISSSHKVYAKNLCQERGQLIWKLPINDQHIGISPNVLFSNKEYELMFPVRDPENRLSIDRAPDGSPAIRVDVNKVINKGVGIKFEHIVEPGISHACLSTQIYLSDNFDFGTAGAILGWGLWGGAGRNDSGGTPPELQEGWTVRNTTNGTHGSKIYSYHLNRTGIRVNNDKCPVYGCVFGGTSTSSGPLISGKWISVDIELKINDIATSNGYAKLWIDKKLVAEYQSLILRDLDHNWMIRGVQFNDIWNERSGSLRPLHLKTQSIYYKPYELYDLTNLESGCAIFGVDSQLSNIEGDREFVTCRDDVVDISQKSIQSKNEIDVHALDLISNNTNRQVQLFSNKQDAVRLLSQITSPQAASLLLVDDFVEVEPDETVSVNPLDNDRDPDGGALEIVGYSLPALGGLTLSDDRRSFIYHAKSLGRDSFVYIVRNSHGVVDSANIEIFIRNAPIDPNPKDDFAETVNTRPITLNVLANDYQEMGEELEIVGYTLPSLGRISIESNNTFLYTPLESMEGVDEFAYTVRNSTGVTANARVFVTISKASDKFANGFGVRRRIVVPQQTAEEIDAVSHVFMVALTDSDLRSQANGGRMRSSHGYDLRFETEQGDVLDHDVEVLDLATGELLAWVRLPSWEPSKSVQIFMYYDSGAVTQDATNPSAVWQDYQGRWNSITGFDSSGNGRNLEVTSVTAGELVGPAGVYDGNAVMTLADSTFQSGWEALTVQAIVKPEIGIVGSNAGILTEGNITGNDSNAGITLQYLESSANGIGNVLHFKARSSDGNAFAISAKDRHSAMMQIIHGTWKSGEIPRLFINGKFEESSANSGVRAGATVVSGPFYIGTGPRNSTAGGWKGLIDEVRVTNRVLHPVVITSEAANIASPELFYGIGTRELPSDQTPLAVAVPFRVTIAAGGSANIAVLDNAFVPDVNDSYSIASVGNPGNGSASAVGSLIRYEPDTGFAGTDMFSYSISNGSHTVSGLIKVEVEQQQSPLFNPVLPNGRRVLLMNATAKRSIFVTPSTLQAALNSALPGDRVILRNGNYNSFSMDRSGTEQNPIVIVADSPRGAVLTGEVNVTGSWLKFDQLAVRDGGHFDVRSPASNLRFDRSLFENNYQSAIRLWPDVINVRVSRNVGRNGREFFIYADIDKPQPPGGPQYVHIDHNYFTGYNTKSTIRLGDTSHAARTFELNAVVEYNYLEKNTGHREMIVGKSSRNWVRYNTITGGNMGDIAIRQGAYWNIYGNFMIEAGGITVVATENQIYNNYIAGGRRGVWVMSGDNTWERTTDERPIYDRGEGCIIANNTVIVTKNTNEGFGIGSNFGQTKFPATNCDVVNNLLLRTSGSAPLISLEAQISNRFDGNVVSAEGDYTGDGVTVADPKLQLRNGIYRPTSSSPTRGAGIAINSFGLTSLTIVNDIEGRPRGATFDVGAEQFDAGEPVVPKTELDDVGFEVIDPYEE